MKKSILLLTTGDSSSNVPLNVWEASSGASLLSLKGENCSNSSLNVLHGNLIVTAAQSKPQINYWEFTRKDQDPKRLFTSSPVTALTFSQDSVFCAAGLHNEIHTWQCCSGDLLSVASGVHRARIVQLKFTWPLTHLVSGDEDGLLAVWRISTLLGGSADSGLHARSHIEPVWSQRISGTNSLCFDVQGVAPRSIVTAASRNGDIIIFDLPTGSVLARSSSDNREIFSLVMNSLSTSIYCGLDKGSIIRVDLASRMDTSIDGVQPHQITYSYHKEEADSDSPVECLCLSPDDSLLASGTRSGSVIVISVHSMLPISKVRLDYTRLTNMLLIQRPTHLDDSNNFTQKAVIMPLKRTLDERSEFMTLILPSRKRKLYTEEELDAYLLKSSDSVEELSTSESSSDRVITDLKMQILQLKDQLVAASEDTPTQSLAELEQEIAQLKKANSELYKKAVVNILSPK